MALGINANYEAFVNWASSRTADTIADAASGLDGKMVVSDKTGDGIGIIAWIKRGGLQKDANNATRELFLGAVRDMFGGEAFIPESVKKAMHFSLFKSESGKPLSARRINEVKVAIDQWSADNDRGLGFMAALASNKAQIATNKRSLKTLDANYSQAMVSDAMAHLGVKLDKTAAKEAARLVAKYGTKMPVKNLAVLSNYVVNLAQTRPTRGLDRAAEEMIAKLVQNDMKYWREFDFDDMRLRQIGKNCVQNMNAYIRDNISNFAMLGGTIAGKNYPNVATQMYNDIDNGTWDLNGTKFGFRSDRAEVIKTFDSVVGAKNPNVSKVLSMLLNQLSFKDSEMIAQKFDKTQGAELFVSRDIQRDGMGITNSKGFSLHYGLELSEDGNTATVTVAIDKDISSNGSAFNEFKIGKTTWTQKITVDLTKEIPEVTDVKIAQTIDPGKIDIKPGELNAPAEYFS